MKSKFLPYGSQFIDSIDRSKILKVLKSHFITQGPEIEKFENKNPQKLGDEVKLVTQLSKTQRFISFGRTTYGDDIKQFFTAVTENGNIFTSEDLDSWSKVAFIPLTK